MGALSNDKYVVSLTALRGLAALAVLIIHSISIGQSAGPGAIGFGRGYLPVDLFFFLSGFVLALSYGEIFVGTTSFNMVRSFLWARIARIYPVHLVVLALLLPFYGIDASFSGIALLKNLLLIQSPWSVYPTWNYPAWSISAEWHAYLLFPFIVTVLLRGSASSVCRIVFYSVVALAIAAWWYDGLMNIPSGPAVLLRTLPEFMGGIVLYRLYRQGAGAKWLSRDISFCAIISACGVVSLIPYTDIVIIATILPALLLAVAYNAGVVARVLALPPFQFLGHISYSLYMVQMLSALVVFFGRPLLVADGNASVAEDAAMYIALSFLLGAAVSLFVEHPARAWVRSAFFIPKISVGDTST